MLIIESLVLVILSFILVVWLVFNLESIYRKIKLKLQIKKVLTDKFAYTKKDIGTFKVAQTRASLILERLSKLSLPKEGWQSSDLKLKFIRAGIRDNRVSTYFFAIKTIGFIVLPLLNLFIFGTFLDLAGSTLFLLTVISAITGYLGPELYISHRTSYRKRDMTNHLPDLIDLLVIATESGMGMDAAINRVSREIAKSSPVLAEEFYMSSLEIRAGASRIQSLKNLALRVNLEDLNNLVNMLSQSDKFGTSLANSLRIQSELMRTKRMQRAEELAAKIPVKMLFPMIFFMFPAVMIVLIGPAIIQVANVFGAR